MRHSKDEVLTKTGTLRKEWQGKIGLETSPYLNTEYLGILVDSTNVLAKEFAHALAKDTTGNKLWIRSTEDGALFAELVRHGG